MLNEELPRENELQRLLTDERSRCHQYKQIYQTLKEKHISDVHGLKEELTIIHQKLKDTVSQHNSDRSSKESYIKKLEQTVRDKQKEVSELKKQLSSLDSVELRKQIQQEEKKKYEEELKTIRNDCQSIQEQFNVSHYDNKVLKSQLEYFEKEKNRTLELLEAQHESEVNRLKDEISILEGERDGNQPPKDYFVEFKSAEKEILQLTMRVRGLHAECEELRAQNENLAVQKEEDFQCNTKQINEKIASIRALESEKESLSMQKEVIRQELSKVQNEKSSLFDELQSQKLNCLSLKNQLEDCKRDHSINSTNLQIAAQQQQAELESRNNRLKSQLGGFQSEIAQLKSELESDKKISCAKEDSYQRNLLAVKQHHLKKFSDLEFVKDSMEQKLKEIEVNKREESLQLQEKLKQVSLELLSANKEREALQKNASVLKTKLEESNHCDKKIFNELANQNKEMQKEIEMLKEKINELITRHKETVMVQAAAPPQKPVEYQSKENVAFEEVSQLRLTLEQQKYQYQQRIDNVESHFREQQNIWSCEKKEFQGKVKQYGRLISKLRDRLDVQITLVEEMEVQNEILKLNIPPEEHQILKDKLHELQRKQDEFHQVMLTTLPFAPEASEVNLVTADPLQSSRSNPLPLHTSQEQPVQVDKRKRDQEKSPRRRFSRIRRSAGRRPQRDYSSTSDIEITRSKLT